MSNKILIPLFGNDVAPRFDLTTEVLIVTFDDKTKFNEKKTVVLPRASSEQLCHLIITEGVQTVICNGIEDDYYQYLTWKRVKMIDSVIGPCQSVLMRFAEKRLKSGDIL